MTDESLRAVVRGYYEAWARQDRAGVRSFLADTLDFRSPEDHFAAADDFLDACWRYSEGLNGVGFLREVYGDGRAFVVLGWLTEAGGSFVGAEYLRVESGRIHEIVVVNNTAGFAELFH